MRNVVEENERIGALLKYELDKNYSREVVTIAKGQNLKMGTVLGKIKTDDTYKIVSIAEEESDGSDVAVGILLQDVDATTVATKALVLARIGIVSASKVIYPDAISEDQKKSILAQLETRGIITREDA